MAKAGLIRAESFEVIEGREVLDGVGEGDEFAVDRVRRVGARGRRSALVWPRQRVGR